MAIAIVHAFVSPKADPPDTSLVRPSNWNANHQLTMATARLIGRTTGGAGAAEEISVGGALTLTGGALSLPTDAVTNAYLANMAASTIKGRITGSTGDPEDLTVAQVTSMLDQFTSSLKGVVPASGGGTSNFLRADGNWAAPPASSIQTLLDGISAVRGATLYRGSGGWTGLSPGNLGQALIANGTGADPAYQHINGVLLASGNGANAATLDISLPSGYSYYRLVFTRMKPSTNGTNLVARLSTNNGSSYISSGYIWTWLYTNHSNATIAVANQTTSAIDSGVFIQSSATNASNWGNPGYIDIFPPAYGTSDETTVLQGHVTYVSSSFGLLQATFTGGTIADGPTNIRLSYSTGNIADYVYRLYGFV